jgi:phage terminase large subunit GpA-like protein
VYRLGQIPNEYAKKYSGSPILFLTCEVDVHKTNLAISVFGWCRDSKSYVIEYFRDEIDGEDADCSELTSPVWGRLRKLIEEKKYTADDGLEYGISLTLIDAGYANDTVTTFCSDYDSGVYPIIGRDRPSKNQKISEFAEFKTQAGTIGYRILVDHYKDRLAPVLRRDWVEDAGDQGKYHFNAPVDILDKHLKELTVETRRKKVDENGGVTYFWHRPGNARNELWDLLVYGHAGVEILAWMICIQHFELKTIEWPKFWDFMEENLEAA